MKTQREKRKLFVTAMEKRALALAEVMVDASGLRWQSSQIPGLALILVAFATNELHLAGRDRLETAVREIGTAARIDGHV